MAVDNIARALAAKALESSAGSVTPEDFTDEHLIKWDAASMSFVDAGETIDGIKTYVNDKISESITTVLNTPV